jgi:hypothetical protein
VAEGIPCDAWSSPVRSAECLPSRFGADGWQQQQLSCFLSITWLGIQGVEVLTLLGALFTPSVAPVSQHDF